MRHAHWLPPVVWMAVIMWLSSDTGSAEHTGQWLLPWLRWLLPWATPGQLDAIHGLARRAAHLGEYAILAALWFRAFARGRALAPRVAASAALALSVGWAFLDEWHQSTLPSRTGSAMDVVLDSAGALGALVVARRGWRGSVNAVTAGILWVAAVGGAVVLTINAVLGVPSGALWLTAPAAVLALLARRRLRR